MKLSISKDDYKKLIEYCAYIAENRNPCDACSRNSIECDFCFQSDGWKKACSELSDGIEYILENKEVKQHIENICEYSDILNKIKLLSDKKILLEKLIFDFEHSLFVKD